MRRILFPLLAALALVGSAAAPALADQGTTSTTSSSVLITVYNPGFVANAITGRVQNVPSGVNRLTVVLTLKDGSVRNYDVGPFNGWSFVFNGVWQYQFGSIMVAGLPSGTANPTVETTAGYSADTIYGYGYGYGGYGYGYDGGYGYGGYGYGGYCGFGYGYPYRYW